METRPTPISWPSWIRREHADEDTGANRDQDLGNHGQAQFQTASSRSSAIAVPASVTHWQTHCLEVNDTTLVAFVVRSAEAW